MFKGQKVSALGGAPMPTIIEDLPCPLLLKREQDKPQI